MMLGALIYNNRVSECPCQTGTWEETMTPRIHDYPGRPTEDALLTKIENALDSVLSDLGLPTQEEAHVKRQKYLYLAIDHFTEDGDDPITYSWFKWGVSCKGGPGTDGPGQTLWTDTTRAYSLLEAQPSEIEDFLRNRVTHIPLEEWWEEDFFDFLDQFYSHHAPPEYRDLYLANLDLLRILDDIQAAVYHGRDPARPETYEDVIDRTSELNQEILAIDHLEDRYRYTSDFTNLFEDVAMMLTELQGQDLERGHNTVMSELKKFYRDHVWLMVAHKISLHTAVGPNADMIHEDSDNKLTTLRSQFDEELRQNRQRCDAMDLLPSVGDYPDFESESEEEQSEFDEKFDELMKVVDGRNNE